MTGHAPVGFVALWNKTPAEYEATKSDEWGTTERIQQAFAAGRTRGNVTYGLYNVRWASAYAYMTFWRCPDLGALTATIRDLEAAGDFKFADSLHVIGSSIAPSPFLDERHLGTVPDVVDGAASPVALFVCWQRPHNNGAVGTSDVVRQALLSTRTQLLGEYASRVSSSWDRFAFLVAPSAEAANRVATALGQTRDRLGTETELIMGVLERYYRFASHLQTKFPWLASEGEA